MVTPVRRRFWSKVSFGHGPDACWIWMAYRDPQCYGHVTTNGVKDRAHRVALRMGGAAVGAGIHVLHGCDNPACVRPSHLHVGTQAQNVREAVERDRMAHGREHWCARLSGHAVRVIRRLRGRVSQKALGALFGVSQQTVSYAQRGRTWARAGSP